MEEILVKLLWTLLFAGPTAALCAFLVIEQLRWEARHAVGERRPRTNPPARGSHRAY